MGDRSGRNVRTTDDALHMVRSWDPGSVPCRLGGGVEIRLGAVSEIEGSEWVEATLPDGTTGYILGTALRGHTDIQETALQERPRAPAGSATTPPNSRAGFAAGWVLVVLGVVLGSLSAPAMLFVVAWGIGLIRSWPAKRIAITLACVALFVLLPVLTVPQLQRNVDKARVTVGRAQIQGFMGALGTYKLDNGSFPTTEQGLRALRERPADAPKWNGPYMPQEIPKDPWGHDYVYKFPGDHGDEPDIISYGADGQPGGDGINADVVSWKSQ